MKSMILPCVILSSLVLGCSGTDFGPIAPVTGKVTLNGKTVAKGTQLVFMEMEKGYAGFGFTDENGIYKIEWRRENKQFEGLPIGTYKVMVQPPVVLDIEQMSADELLDGGAEDVAVVEPEFDKKYRQTATSGLQFEIKNEANVIDIDLK